MEKEYIVTLHNFEDLDSFYEDMETSGGNLYIPNRAVEVINRRPISRSTHYNLTDEEADIIRKDPRVRSVELLPALRNLVPKLSYTQTANFNKNTFMFSDMYNWGLLRSTIENNITNWGQDKEGSTTSTIEIQTSGTHVDVVIVDDIIKTNHQEFNNRVNSYNWYDNHDIVVRGGATTIIGISRTNNIATITTLLPHYILNGVSIKVNCSTDNSFNTLESIVLTSNTYTVTYSNVGPNVSLTSASGTVTKSLYSYIPNSSDHGTHVAGTVAGKTQGWARNANIYNLRFDDPLTPGEQLIDYIREFHKNKPINPATGRKNPTICNHSWGYFFNWDGGLPFITNVNYRGVTYNRPNNNPLGVNGVYSKVTEIKQLLGYQNFGNRITTTLGLGSVLSYPPAWTLDKQLKKCYYFAFQTPLPSNEIQVQGPCNIRVVNDIAVELDSGSANLTTRVVIKENGVTVQTLSGPTISGQVISSNLRETTYLPNNSIYSIFYEVDTDYTGTLFSYATVQNLDILEKHECNVTSITPALYGTSGLTSSVTPTYGNNDNGAWAISLPFSVSYLGTQFSSIFPMTNGGLSFGEVVTSPISLTSTSMPEVPAIYIGAGNLSCQRIWHGLIDSTVGDRKYLIRWEGHSSSTGGVLGSPTVLWEMTFYESPSNQIDIQIGNNARIGSTFTYQELENFGIIREIARVIPSVVDGVDADMEDAVNEGIIMVAASGNLGFKIDKIGGIDYNNYLDILIGAQVYRYFYHRGSSPGSAISCIKVGAVDSRATDRKAYFSSSGPGVDIYAPGNNIVSSVFSSENAFFNNDEYGKLSGTSMASPQVTGVLACLLETYPRMDQEQAKDLILSMANNNQLTETGSSYTDLFWLQNGNNKLLYLKKLRPNNGLSYPNVSNKSRPASGLTYPRLSIYKSK